MHKHAISRRILVALLTMLLIVSILPMGALAAPGDFQVLTSTETVIDLSGDEYTNTGEYYSYSGNTLTIKKGGVTLTGTAAVGTHNITIGSDFGTGTITLNNAKIDCSSASRTALAIPSGASVNLVLAANSDNMLYGGQQCNAIGVPGGAEVTISSLDPDLNPGKLDLYSTHHLAIIGGTRYGTAGTINIESGIIKAHNDSSGGQSTAPGIGSQQGGIVNISGGTVRTTANGESGNGAAGISASEVNISGGAKVTVSGNYNSGGFDTATGNRGGIGATNTSTPCKITISGANTVVTTMATGNSKDIGGPAPAATELIMTGGTLNMNGNGMGLAADKYSFKNCTVGGSAASTLAGKYGADGMLLIGDVVANLSLSDTDLTQAAADSSGAFSYDDIDKVVSILGDNVEIKGTSTDRRIEVPASFTGTNIYLNGADITSSANAAAFDIASGESATLILVDQTENKVTNTAQDWAAIRVPTGATLTIKSMYGSNTGKLFATAANDDGAIIGGGNGGDASGNEGAGTINIQSGTVSTISTSAGSGAAIGAGANTTSGSTFDAINITGGIVTATNESTVAAAIGAGEGTSGIGAGGPITISGLYTIVTADGAGKDISGTKLDMTGGQLYLQSNGIEDATGSVGGSDTSKPSFKSCAVLGTGAGDHLGVYDENGNKTGAQSAEAIIDFSASDIELTNAAEASNGAFEKQSNEFILLKDVTLTGSSSSYMITIPDGTNNIVVTMDGAELLNGLPVALKGDASATFLLKAGTVSKFMGSANAAPLNVPQGTTLTIKSTTPGPGEDPGKIEVGGAGGHGALIGGSGVGRASETPIQVGGTINIESGFVELLATTTTQNNSAGSGIGGARGSGATIKIKGGKVIARPGGISGAGLGGGGATVEISGGEVESYGGTSAGSGITAGTLKVSGSGTVVKATGTNTTADINIGSGTLTVSDNAKLYLLKNFPTLTSPSFTDCTITGNGAGKHAGTYDASSVQTRWIIPVTAASIDTTTVAYDDSAASIGLSATISDSNVQTDIDLKGTVAFQYQKQGDATWTEIKTLAIAGTSAADIWAPGKTLTPGTYSIRAIYKQFDADKDGYSAGPEETTATTANLTVTKGTAAFVALSETITATYGDKLGDVQLPANYTWDADLTQVVLGDVEDTAIFNAKYNPDAANYNDSSSGTVTVTISEKAAPVIATKPTVSNVAYGKTLADVTIDKASAVINGVVAGDTVTGTLAWKNAAADVKKSGNYAMVFTPDVSSSTNYKYVEFDVQVKVLYTVAFNSDGGSAVASITAVEGARIAAPKDVTRKGYHLDGWYLGSRKWDFSKNIVSASNATNGVITLKAKWLTAVTGVSLDKASASVNAAAPGNTVQLTATVAPENAANKGVKWASSDSSIATVSTKGLVTGKKAGTVTITVTTNDGAKTASCKITVKSVEPTTPTESGWYQQSGSWVHVNTSGNVDTGWFKDETGEWYYSNASGAMETGWLQLGDTWYYLAPSGEMASGYQQVGGRWSSFASSGKWNGYADNTGWQQFSGGWSFRANGSWAYGWAKINGSWYYFNGSGYMVTGWRQIGSTWYYFKGSGAMATNEWVSSGGSWYWMKQSGAMASNEWMQKGNTWYWLKSSGVMASGEWLQQGGTWYYLKASGAMTSGEWLQQGSTWYYLKASGAMATTDTQIGGVVHKFNASGAWLGKK